MNWQINEEDLDASQRKIYNLSTNLNAIVRGVAGSGKTNLALWRAYFIKETEGNQNFKVLIYTKALRRFIEAGLLSMDLENNVVHYHKWDMQPVDYIIVDESQDFSKEIIQTILSKVKKSIIFFGDNAQQLYGEDKMKIDDIQKLTGFPVYDLDFNYRLPISVARFAQIVNPDNNDIISTSKNPDTTKPRIIKFNSWQEELDFIINEIKTRNLFGSGTESTAILLPFNTRGSVGIAPFYYSVENVKDYLKAKEFDNLFKMYDEVELDFNSNLPKIMTYHSAKGLQFDTVFMPHCGENWDIYKNPFYVALTRTSRQLIITHSDKLSRYIQQVPSNLGLYETK
jgi:superfamily I DNA/RNA helicase